MTSPDQHLTALSPEERGRAAVADAPSSYRNVPAQPVRLRKAVAVGVDLAARHDKMSVAVLHGTRMPDGAVTAVLVALTGESGIDWEDHAAVVRDVVAEQDRKTEPGIPVLCYTDSTGAGQTAGSLLVKAFTPGHDGRSPGMRRRIGFRAVSMQGGITQSSPRPGWLTVSRDAVLGRAVMNIRNRNIDLSKVKRSSRAAVEELLAELESFTSTVNERTGKERFAAAVGDRHFDDHLVSVSLAYAALVDLLGVPESTITLPPRRDINRPAPRDQWNGAR